VPSGAQHRPFFPFLKLFQQASHLQSLRDDHPSCGIFSCIMRKMAAGSLKNRRACFRRQTATNPTASGFPISKPDRDRWPAASVDVNSVGQCSRVTLVATSPFRVCLSTSDAQGDTGDESVRLRFQFLPCRFILKQSQGRPARTRISTFFGLDMQLFAAELGLWPRVARPRASIDERQEHGARPICGRPASPGGARNEAATGGLVTTPRSRDRGIIPGSDLIS